MKDTVPVLKAGCLVSCFCDFDVCIWVFVWGGVLETSFLLFLHLFFGGVLCSMYMYV